MHPRVRDLYKRLLLVGCAYPGGKEYVRARAKRGIRANALITGERRILKAVARGRKVVRDVAAFNQFHKYRQMNKRYGETSASREAVPAEGRGRGGAADRGEGGKRVAEK